MTFVLVVVGAAVAVAPGVWPGLGGRVLPAGVLLVLAAGVARTARRR